MAIAKTDYKFHDAKKIIESLDDSIENELIKYYIHIQDETIKAQNKRLEEYQDVFNRISRFMPNSKPSMRGGKYDIF